MPSAQERLATLEIQVRELERDVARLFADIHGGQGVEWNRSLRGRLHDIEGDLAALAMRLRFGLAMSKLWVQALLLACAVATAAAAWYAALYP